MYDQFGGTPESVLDQIYQLGDIAKEQYDFLKKIHDMRLFWGDFVNTQYDSPKVRVEIDFNINRRDESNTRYLVDRIFKPNNDSNIEFISEDKSAIWYYGEPVQIQFRWANDDSIERPNYDPNDPDIIVENSEATIECVGSWALLRFLQKYQANDGTNSDKLLTNQNLLCFKIPLTNGQVAKIYAAITASTPLKPGVPSITTLKAPTSPEIMPEMSKSITSLSTSPVLVERMSSIYTVSIEDVDVETIEEESEKKDNEEDNESKEKDKKEIKKKANKSKKKKTTKATNKTISTTKKKTPTEQARAMEILESDEEPKDDDNIITVSDEEIE